MYADDPVVCLGRTAAATNSFASQHESCLCGSHEWVNNERRSFLLLLYTSESGHKMLLFLDLTSSRLGPFHQFSGRVEVLQLLSLTLTSLFLPGTFPLSCSCPALSLSPYCSFFSPLAWPICHINEKAGPPRFGLACRCDEMERWWKRRGAVD